ncbi:MAG: hypothetical protein HQK83_17155 [Fibrobacteria bacterium]|nr:hypothetical protein [Fibrobacteria bacterium]
MNYLLGVLIKNWKKWNSLETCLTDMPLTAPKMKLSGKDPEKAEHVVGIEWLKTVTVSEAVKEKGFFGNQNTVARPTSAKWEHTVERLKKRFGVE